MTMIPARPSQEHMFVNDIEQDDEMCIVLDSDDDSSGSESSLAHASVYQVQQPMEERMKKPVPRFENRSIKSQSRPVPDRKTASKMVIKSSPDIKHCSATSSASKESLLSPVKAIERAKRTKIWEKASLYEKSLTAQPQPLLSSPRRRALPEALKPALDLFEGRTLNKRKKDEGNESGSLLDMDDLSNADQYDEQHCRLPRGNLKATLEKFEKLSRLAKEKNSVEHRVKTEGRKAKRRKSAGNGIVSGNTVDEKMWQIDALFQLHHKVKGTDIDSLAAMRESVKEAHRQDFEKQVQAINKQYLLGRYQQRILVEQAQRDLRKKDLAKDVFDFSSITNLKDFKDMFQSKKLPYGKMKRRASIGRYVHEYTPTDNDVLMQLLYEYQSRNLSLRLNGDELHTSTGPLKQLSNSYGDVSKDDDVAEENVSVGNHSRRSARGGSGLRPGVQRGSSFDRDSDIGSAMQEAAARSSSDESHDRAPRRRGRGGMGLRPGVQRGASFDRDSGVAVAMQEAAARSSYDDTEERAPRRRGGSGTGLRPGVQRGLSFDKDSDIGSAMQEAAHSSYDDSDELAPRRRPRGGTGMRPSVQRGASFDRDSGVAVAMQEAAAHSNYDDSDELAPRRRVRGGSGLRPGVQRGLSFDKDSDIGSAMQEAAHNRFDESDESAPRRRPRGGTGMRPSVQRGASFDRDSGVAVAMQEAAAHSSYDDTEELAPRRRVRGGSGLRPGVQRGLSFDKDSDIGSAMQEAAAHSSFDDSDELAPRRRGRGGSGLRPGVQRGLSFDKDSDIGSAMQEAAAHSSFDDSDELAPRRRGRGGSGLRPGVQRGLSFDRDSGVGFAVQEAAHGSFGETDESGPRGATGMRPGMQRGTSFVRDSEVAVTMQEDDSSSDECDEVTSGLPEMISDAHENPVIEDSSDESTYKVYYESDSEDDDGGCRMKRVDRLLAKSSKYLGKGSSAAHTSIAKKKSDRRK